MSRSWAALLVLIGAASAAAQSFEAASVKPVQLMDLRGRYRWIEGGPDSKTPSRIAGHTTMMWMVQRAYGVNTQRISGPPWMEMEFFEIAAVLPPGATKEQEKVMWQNLLKERFHFEAHREKRELPVYALVVGKNGPKLKPSDPAAEAADKEQAAALAGQPRPKVTKGPDGFPEIPADFKMPGSYVLSLSSGEFMRVKMFGKHQTMAELAGGLGGFAGRLIEDQTGLKGKFDFTLAFETDPRQPAPGSQAPPASIPAERGASLFSALQEQLGLKLESRRSVVEMLVIDHVEKVPTEN